MTQPPLPPPGWYPDPQPSPEQHGAPERYWDGGAWTGHTREAGGTGLAAGSPTGPSASPWQGQPPGTAPGGPPYTQHPYGAPPQQAGNTQQTGNTLSIIGIVCGAVAFIFCPILLGPAGIVLGAVGRSKGESLGTVAIVVGAVGLVVGMIVGFLVFQTMEPMGL